MTQFRYIEAEGDASVPASKITPTIIAHVVNDLGFWGRGFVLSLSKRWPITKEAYIKWKGGENRFEGDKAFSLGNVQIIQVQNSVYVANMAAQHGIAKAPGDSPIRYGALEECLEKVAAAAAKKNAVVQMPKIGAGLAGGDWGKIEKIIDRALLQKNIAVYVVSLPGASKKNAKINYIEEGGLSYFENLSKPCILAHSVTEWVRDSDGYLTITEGKWPESKYELVNWSRVLGDMPGIFKLGMCHPYKVKEGKWIIRMVCFTGYPWKEPALDYGCLEECLEKIARWAKKHEASVCMPVIGKDIKTFGLLVAGTIAKKGIDVNILGKEVAPANTKVVKYKKKISGAQNKLTAALG